ncbi:VPLPA-CTERM sorting domain-containing protein [uncultured Tateyamaria sp.]|uniref:VPLPA-CTERM sorting domain-containing protein n=1 Tax=uncultured Tateyamaria sp. TaxID=455651 RepID=UPI002614799E|nr:VPLPA-CTERM sorting domain-containing protein [uncultured Tateyamaria sp.]
MTPIRVWNCIDGVIDRLALYEVVRKMSLNLFNSIKAGAVAVAITCVGSAASAVTINFDVDRSYTSLTNTYTSTDDSVSVEVDGVRVNGGGTLGSNTNNFWTASWSDNGSGGGLGVYTCSWSNLCVDNGQIDGGGPNEMAMIDFGDLIVEITSITFSFWDSNDTFAYGVYDDAGPGATPVVYDDNVGGSASNPYTFGFGSGDLQGSIIGFGVDNWRDNFLLQSISFDVIAAVPLPAGGLLILTGLGGLALMRRRRSVAVA